MAESFLESFLPKLQVVDIACICDTVHDLVLFVQFKKREKHPWRSVTSAEASNLTKSNTPPWMFFTFIWYKWCQVAQSLSFASF